MPSSLQLPGGQAGALQERPGLVGDRRAAAGPLVGRADHPERRAVAAVASPPALQWVSTVAPARRSSGAPLAPDAGGSASILARDPVGLGHHGARRAPLGGVGGAGRRAA